MAVLRTRTRKHKDATRTQPLRSANNSLRSDVNVCEAMTKKGAKFFRQNPEIYITNIANQTKGIKGGIEYYAYSSADVYINQEMFDFNPRSKIFTRARASGHGVILASEDESDKEEFVRFNPRVTKRWVVVKIALPGHYAVALVDQRLRKVEFFDAGGVHEDWIIRRVKSLFSATLPSYKLVISQRELLQEDEYDGYCQTWVWVWLYFRLYRGWSHTQFKRLFQPLKAKDRVQCVRDAHYYLIN